MKTVKSILSLLLCAVLLCAAVVPAFAAEQTRYVVLGDSISRGAGIRNPDEACYGRIIANTNGYAYANFGVDGNMSDDLVKQAVPGFGRHQRRKSGGYHQHFHRRQRLSAGQYARDDRKGACGKLRADRPHRCRVQREL